MKGRGEQGSSLLELLFAVAILGITSAALLGGIATGFLATGLHRQQTDVGTVLASAGEAVLDQARNPFVPCATTYDTTSGVTLPAGWTSANVVITGPISHWDGTQFQSASCSDLVTAPPAPTLTAVSSGGILPAATYYYRLVYDNGVGGTLAGPEAATSALVGTTSLVIISWLPPVAAAVTEVSVYGRSSGSEKFLGSVPVQTADLLIDIGSLVPTLPVPAASGNLQLVTVTVTSPNGQASQSRSFVKRGP